MTSGNLIGIVSIAVHSIALSAHFLFKVESNANALEVV